MNDDENNPQPQPWIDPALEARIVAGVLGETSAFEAAELERAVAEMPELAIFKRRIEAVHALVGAAVKPENPRLQLSPERRGKLLATLGVSAEKPPKKVAPFTLPRPAWWTSTLLIRAAACLVMGAVFATFLSLIVRFKSSNEPADFYASNLTDREFTGGEVRYKSSSESASQFTGHDRSSFEADVTALVAAAPPTGSPLAQSDRQQLSPAPLAFAMSSTTPSPARMEAQGNASALDNNKQVNSSGANSYTGAVTLASGERGYVVNGGQAFQRPVTVPTSETAEKAASLGLDGNLKSPAVPAALVSDEMMAGDLPKSVVMRKGGDAILFGSTETPAELPSAPVGGAIAKQDADQPATRVAAFTGGWGKGSAEGMDDAKKEAATDSQFVAAKPAEWDSLYMYRGVNVLSKDASPQPELVKENVQAVGNVSGNNLVAGSTTESLTSNVINQPIFTSRNGSVEFDGFVNYGSPISTVAPAKEAQAGQSQKLREEAKNFSDSGRLDLASKRYEQVLEANPADIEARRELEQINGARARSEGIALNETRSQMMAPTVVGWELPTSRDGLERSSVIEKFKSNASSDLLTKEYEIPLGLLPTSDKRSGAKTFLEANNVPFPPGASATYLAGSNKLIVRNTAANLEIIESMVDAQSSAPEPLPQSAEIPTAKQPFSTFSLHVSDVSFQLAKDALAKGTVPDPARIRAEEFYNAFDYNDPAPAPGEEVACRIEQSAHPFRQQRDLVRIALKVAAAGRAAGQPLRLTILLDTSGSMEREDRAVSVRRALKTLATLLGPNDRVTLIGFARTPRLLAEQLPGDQAGKLVEIAQHTPSDGGTNLESALALASELALKQKLPAAQNRIVLLTDGAANLGNADPARLAQEIEKTRQQGISFDACGVGANGLNDGMLEALTRKGDGRYYFLNKPEDADAGFARQLAGALRPAAENVKVQVVFNPARVSQYRLIGFEEHFLKKEDFRNDKVQAAELSAEEAGVALYQVETLPEGEGELGQVFVRFRDPATGSMVERSWPMPYEAKARAFDQASPSMQLATTAALLAEKLRGDSQVDLDALAPVMNRLRGHYPNQARVAELIQMVERARVTKP